MACKGKHYCITSIMKDCHELKIDVKRAEKIDGVLYLFVITLNDGTKVGYHSGKDLMHELRAMKARRCI